MARVKHIREVKESNDVYIGRGSKWGNPYVIGKDGNRDEVIEKYRLYIERTPELLCAISELKGKNLVCFCKPQRCHGDILLKRASS
tara:strand:+ start:1167 stop:1424 length:258 start_codon:yes stop_codon:yes gene_type:complete